MRNLRFFLSAITLLAALLLAWQSPVSGAGVTSPPAPNGVQAASSTPATYTYDAAGRLVRADYAGGKSIIYTYDSTGNLMRREVLVAPTVTFPGGVAGGNVTLSWAHDALYTGYQVWYSTQPYFTPGSDCNAPPAGMSCAFVPAPEHTFTHTGAAADVVNNYAYLVLGGAASGSRSSPSGRVGEFGFGLAPGAP
jgi:YD repeat-containing protein